MNSNAGTTPNLPRPSARSRTLSRGSGLLRELPTDSTDSVVLCTDLHADNVLAARRETWLVIDPKPYTGDRTYDAVQHLLNCDRLLHDPTRLAHRMSHLLDLDATRLKLWLFARCAQESLDQPAQHRQPPGSRHNAVHGLARPCAVSQRST